MLASDTPCRYVSSYFKQSLCGVYSATDCPIKSFLNGEIRDSLSQAKAADILNRCCKGSEQNFLSKAS